MGLVIASIHERRDEYRALLKKRESESKPIFRARRTVGKALGKAPVKREPERQEVGRQEVGHQEAAGQEA
jgi:CPA2 family monovalent cation:H+ antiporter-2